MELCKEFRDICWSEEKDVLCESFELDFQENLPQYLDDINRIICCNVKCIATDYECTGSNIKLYGKSIISLTYRNSNNELASNIFEEEFTKAINSNSNCSLNFAKINLVTKYSSHRLINQRRIDVHISLKAHISAFSNTNDKFLSACKNARLREYNPKLVKESSSGITSLDFDEVFSINDTSSQIKNIVNSYYNCYIDDLKIIKEKMLVKSTVELSVLYENEASTIEKCVHSFTASKIIEIPDCNEDDKAFVNLDLSSVYIKAKPDVSNKLVEIEFVGKLAINYSIYNLFEDSLITDLYFINHNSVNSNIDLKLNVNPTYYYDDSTKELWFSFEEEFKEILDTEIKISNVYIENSNIIYTVNFCAIYVSLNGEISYFEKKEECNLLINDNKLNGKCNLNLTSFDYVIKNDNSLSVRINFEYKAFLFETKTVSVIKDIELDGEKDNSSIPELTLYFANKDENVWDIAKKFSTDMSLIMEENNLSSQIIDNHKVILVPGM